MTGCDLILDADPNSTAGFLKISLAFPAVVPQIQDLLMEATDS